MKNWKRKLALVLLLLGGAAGGVHLYKQEKARRILAELQLVEERQLNDSTRIEFARTKDAEIADLSAALQAEKELNGRLIAAANIKIPARDTVIKHDTIPTYVTEDSTRIAHFQDSTFAGTIEGTVTAPPCCAPLALDYTLHRPAFAPTVAFVQVGDSVVTSVTWNGEQYSISSYAKPHKTTKPLGFWVDFRYILTAPETRTTVANDRYQTTTDSRYYGELGALIRMPLINQIRAGVNTRKEAFVGIHKEF